MRSVRFIVLALLTSGCASYGWADRERSETTAGIHTIGVPPQTRVDEAALTRSLIEELRTRGIRAEWGARSDRDVRCHVKFDELFAGAAEFVTRADLECKVGDESVSRSAAARATLSGEDSTRARETLRLDAAAQAARLATPAIAALLTKTPDAR